MSGSLLQNNLVYRIWMKIKCDFKKCLATLCRLLDVSSWASHCGWWGHLSHVWKISGYSIRFIKRNFSLDSWKCSKIVGKYSWTIKLKTNAISKANAELPLQQLGKLRRKLFRDFIIFLRKILNTTFLELKTKTSKGIQIGKQEFWQLPLLEKWS